VVENGSTDRTLDICLAKPVTCFSYPFRIGHDIGRAIGAREATGDVFLFLDADIVFTVDQLLPFVEACYEGVDVALNHVSPLYKTGAMIDSVSLAKRFLNHTLGKSELKYASLTAVPHAMTRRAVETIGAEHLAIPPKAQAMAIMAQLAVQAVHTVNVFSTNKIRNQNNQKCNVVEEMILGDHVEAIQWIQSKYGERGRYEDNIRKRKMIMDGPVLSDYFS
jgi:glycosyltransferase involved in cell wall biosynthesis